MSVADLAPEWFLENRCELTRPFYGTFLAVYQVSGGRPCSGCNCKDTCPVWPLVQNGGAAVPALKFQMDWRPKCPKCQSPLNAVKVARRGGKCACGASV
jgi:hypothetical protein